MKTQFLAWSMVLAVCTSCQTGDLLNMNGQKVDVSYQVPDGEITGPMTFDINGKKWSDQRIALNFDETAQTISLTGSTESASFAAPDWWGPLHSITAVGSDLKIVNNNPTLFTMRSAQAAYGEDEYRLSNFALTCNSPTLNQLPLDNCLKKGSLKVSEMSMGTAALVTQVLSFVNVNAASTTVANLNLNFSGNDFTLEAKAKLSISVNIKGEGRVEYLPAGSDYNLKIRIDKLKASFLNIKDDLFKELEKSEDEKLKVESPYIYVKF